MRNFFVKEHKKCKFKAGDILREKFRHDEDEEKFWEVIGFDVSFEDEEYGHIIVVLNEVNKLSQATITLDEVNSYCEKVSDKTELKLIKETYGDCWKHYNDNGDNYKKSNCPICKKK